MYTYTYVFVNPSYIYIYIFIIIIITLCHFHRFLRPPSPLISIVHPSRQIFNATSRINREPCLPTPPLGQDMTQGQFFKRSLSGLNSEFSFFKTSCLTKAKELSLSYYFTHSWRENNWIHTFPKFIITM